MAHSGSLKWKGTEFQVGKVINHRSKNNKRTTFEGIDSSAAILLYTIDMLMGIKNMRNVYICSARLIDDVGRANGHREDLSSEHNTEIIM